MSITESNSAVIEILYTWSARATLSPKPVPAASPPSSNSPAQSPLSRSIRPVPAPVSHGFSTTCTRATA